MNDDAAEAAAIRRRWITLGEGVAVAGLIVSALALWNSYADRRTDEAQKAAETRAHSAVFLTATPRHGGEVLALSDAQHPTQSLSIAFPPSLGVAPHTVSGTLELRADWIADAVLAAADKSGARQGRLPVVITAHYWDGDNDVSDAAIYDVMWRSEARLLRGHALRLTGMVLRQRKDATPARADVLWKSAVAGSR
ncbi:hypothetical protein ACLB0R_15260 [Sphingomonas sp. GlSt437]|uniref:hypothetical protein n=1 Tax=Sphingomonas sp. GlSt437 TaxID=3389970 RepID=UPI003A8B9C26